MVWLAAACGVAAEPPAALVPNGGFEAADPENPAAPAHWDRPDGLGVVWTNAPDGESGERGRAMRLDTRVSEKAMVEQWRKVGLDQWDIPDPAESPVAGTYGLSFYSDPIPVSTGCPYRVTFDFMGPSGGGKLWVRGYGELRGRRRRLYETIVNCRGGTDRWTPFSQVFHPTRLRPAVREMRVMLYAYWPPGVYWFDAVRIEPVSEEVYARER
jgi:hypothetical protein